MSEVKVVSVFASAPGGGNPAPVVLDASGYDEARMLELARRYNLESSFVFPPHRTTRGHRADPHPSPCLC